MANFNPRAFLDGTMECSHPILLADDKTIECPICQEKYPCDAKTSQIIHVTSLHHGRYVVRTLFNKYVLQNIDKEELDIKSIFRIIQPELEEFIEQTDPNQFEKIIHTKQKRMYYAWLGRGR